VEISALIIRRGCFVLQVSIRAKEINKSRDKDLENFHPGLRFESTLFLGSFYQARLNFLLEGAYFPRMIRPYPVEPVLFWGERKIKGKAVWKVLVFPYRTSSLPSLLKSGSKSTFTPLNPTFHSLATSAFVWPTISPSRLRARERARLRLRAHQPTFSFRHQPFTRLFSPKNDSAI